MTVRNEPVAYQVDGLAMAGTFYWDDASAAPRPGIAVFPEALGLGDHARSRAERLAGLGYAALACDLHGDGRMITMDEVIAIIGALMQDPERLRDRARSGIAALAARPEVDAARLAAIGFCFGGTMALELARSGAPIAAAIGFHSGLTAVKAADPGSIKAKVLVCIGADDPTIPPEQRAAFETEMRSAGADWRMHLYGGVMHSFTNPDVDAMGMPGFAYDAKAEARSWTEMRALLNETLG